MRTGTSPLVSYALYIAIGITVIVLAVQGVRPYVESTRDSSEISRIIDSFGALGDDIDAIVKQARDAQSTFRLRVSRGNVFLANGSLVYAVTTQSGVISEGSNRSIGRIVIAATAEPNRSEKRVTVTLDYNQSDVLLQGFNGTLGSGIHQLSLRNEGRDGNRTVIRVSR